MLETRQKAARQMDHKGKGERARPEYPDRMPALRAGDVMASLTRRTFPLKGGKVNKGGTARLMIPALSFEKDRAVFYLFRRIVMKHYVLMRLKPGVFDE